MCRAEKEWGDGIRGMSLTAARYALLRLEEAEPHTKNWRPQLLILIKPTDENLPKYRKLFSFASQLKAGKGLTMCVSVVNGEFTKKVNKANETKANIRRIMEEERVKGFVEVLVSRNTVDGLSSMYVLQPKNLISNFFLTQTVPRSLFIASSMSAPFLDGCSSFGHLSPILSVRTFLFFPMKTAIKVSPSRSIKLCFCVLFLLLFAHFSIFFYSRNCSCAWDSVQTIGLGGMKPNTVILGWPYGWRQSEHDRTWKAFLETCRVCASSKLALVIPKGINFFPDSTEKVNVFTATATGWLAGHAGFGLYTVYSLQPIHSNKQF